MTKKKPQAKAKAPKTETTKAGFPEYEGLGLNLKQQIFVKAYVRPDMAFNATRAYIEAYGLDGIDDYMTANACAPRLLANASVQKAVSIEIARYAKNHDAVAEATIQSWAVSAFSNIFDFLNVTGPFVHLKDMQDIPPHLHHLIKNIESTTAGIKVTFCDKDRAKENIAKALGMFTENVRQVDEKYENIVQRLTRQEAEKNGEAQ